MFARVSTYAGTPEEAQAGVSSFDATTESLRSLDGFEGAYFLLDQDAGKAISITMWSSQETAQASAERARQIRGEAAQTAGLSIQSVETYEVAMQIEPGS